VLDGAVAVFDGVNGVEPQSETVWRQADKYKVPRICFINKMDRIGADFEMSVKSIRDRLGANPLVLQLPLGTEEKLKGVIDLVRMKAIVFTDSDKGSNFEVLEIPPEYAEAASAARMKVIEAAAELDRRSHYPFVTQSRSASRATICTPSITFGTRGASWGTKSVHSTCGAWCSEEIGGIRRARSRRASGISASTVAGFRHAFASPRSSRCPSGDVVTTSHSGSLPCHQRAPGSQSPSELTWRRHSSSKALPTRAGK